MTPEIKQAIQNPDAAIQKLDEMSDDQLASIVQEGAATNIITPAEDNKDMAITSIDFATPDVEQLLDEASDESLKKFLEENETPDAGTIPGALN
jgi:hypothetical protein